MKSPLEMKDYQSIALFYKNNMKTNYSLFYSYKNIGDVLLVVFDNDLKATSHIRKGQVEVIYHDEQIIGYNIFDISKIIKIKTQGLIYLPSKELVAIINSILKNNDVEELANPTSSGYIIGEVVDITNKGDKKVVSIDIGKEIVKAFTNNEIHIKDKIVVATLHTRLNDGRTVKIIDDTNAFIVTEKDLQISNSNNILFLDVEEENGKDFFTMEMR